MQKMKHANIKYLYYFIHIIYYYYTDLAIVYLYKITTFFIGLVMHLLFL